MPRTGRPKSENPKEIDIKVRIDRDTNEKLLSYCKLNSINRATAVRNAILSLIKGSKGDIK